MANPLKVDILPGRPNVGNAAGMDLLAPDPASGTSEFSMAKGSLLPPASKMTTGEMQFDMSKPDFKLSRGLTEGINVEGGSDHQIKPDLDGRKTLTTGQRIGLTAVSSGLQAAGKMAEIRDEERMIMDQMDNDFLDRSALRRAAAIQRGAERVRQLIAAMSNLDKQGEAPQTGDAQSQQFFTSPTTGASI